MNILIYGDHSAAGLNLIPGFNSLGCSVDYVSNFDPKRGYFVSIPIRTGKSKNVRRISGFINSLLLPIRLKKKYDLIILPNPFAGPFMLSDWVFKMLRNRTQNLIWWAITCDTKMRIWREPRDTPLCQACNKQRGTVNNCPKFNDTGIKFERIVESYVDEIIPCALEYADGRFAENPDLKIIPLSTSITSKKPKNIDIGPKDKINFYHGANSIFKGSDVIGQAFSYGEKKWNKNANFNLAKFLPLDEYISFIYSQDAIVDQLYNESFGVNALLIMQTGSLLLVGNTEKFESFTHQNEAPIVRLTGELSNLEDSIDDIILKSDYYNEMRLSGPAYIEKYHSPSVIAKQFLDRIKN